MATLGKKVSEEGNFWNYRTTSKTSNNASLPQFSTQGFWAELKVLIHLIKMSWNNNVIGPDHTQQKFWDYVGKDIK